jgi:hypothetical protein
LQGKQGKKLKEEQILSSAPPKKRAPYPAAAGASCDTAIKKRPSPLPEEKDVCTDL